MSKVIKVKKNNTEIDIHKVCQIASRFLYIYISDYTDYNNIEIYYGTPKTFKELIEEIKNNLPENNSFKNSSTKLILNLLKKNILLIELYKNKSYLESAVDHSWDNAEFNGAS